MPPRMLHGRMHVLGSLKALAMTMLIALLALGVSGEHTDYVLARVMRAEHWHWHPARAIAVA